jgi:hypothetical protein
MRDELLQLLLSVDDAEGCEHPAGFDHAAAMARVQALRPALDALAGLHLGLDDQVQDASFFAELAALREGDVPGVGRAMIALVLVRFSCFGQLCCVQVADDQDPTLAVRLEDTLRQAGYVPVPVDELDTPYTGPNQRLRDASWRIRFFDYL